MGEPEERPQPIDTRFLRTTGIPLPNLLVRLRIAVLYIAYERVQGPSLADWLAQNPNRMSAAVSRKSSQPWPMPSSTRTSRSIIHRDLKPANVLIDTSSLKGAIDESELIKAQRSRTSAWQKDISTTCNR